MSTRDVAVPCIDFETLRSVISNETRRAMPECTDHVSLNGASLRTFRTPNGYKYSVRSGSDGQRCLTNEGVPGRSPPCWLSRRNSSSMPDSGEQS
jgi:hypothetical protein